MSFSSKEHLRTTPSNRSLDEKVPARPTSSRSCANLSVKDLPRAASVNSKTAQVPPKSPRQRPSGVQLQSPQSQCVDERGKCRRHSTCERGKKDAAVPVRRLTEGNSPQKLSVQTDGNSPSRAAQLKATSTPRFPMSVAKTREQEEITRLQKLRSVAIWEWEQLHVDLAAGRYQCSDTLFSIAATMLRLGHPATNCVLQWCKDDCVVPEDMDQGIVLARTRLTQTNGQKNLFRCCRSANRPLALLAKWTKALLEKRVVPRKQSTLSDEPQQTDDADEICDSALDKVKRLMESMEAQVDDGNQQTTAASPAQAAFVDSILRENLLLKQQISEQQRQIDDNYVQSMQTWCHETLLRSPRRIDVSGDSFGGSLVVSVVEMDDFGGLDSARRRSQSTFSPTLSDRSGRAGGASPSYCSPRMIPQRIFRSSSVGGVTLPYELVPRSSSVERSQSTGIWPNALGSDASALCPNNGASPLGLLSPDTGSRLVSPRIGINLAPRMAPLPESAASLPCHVEASSTQEPERSSSPLAESATLPVAEAAATVHPEVTATPESEQTPSASPPVELSTLATSELDASTHWTPPQESSALLESGQIAISQPTPSTSSFAESVAPPVSEPTTSTQSVPSTSPLTASCAHVLPEVDFPPLLESSASSRGSVSSEKSSTDAQAQTVLAFTPRSQRALVAPSENVQTGSITPYSMPSLTSPSNSIAGQGSLLTDASLSLNAPARVESPVRSSTPDSPLPGVSGILLPISCSESSPVREPDKPGLRRDRSYLLIEYIQRPAPEGDEHAEAACSPSPSCDNSPNHSPDQPNLQRQVSLRLVHASGGFEAPASDAIASEPETQPKTLDPPPPPPSNPAVPMPSRMSTHRRSLPDVRLSPLLAMGTPQAAVREVRLGSHDLPAAMEVPRKMFLASNVGVGNSTSSFDCAPRPWVDTHSLRPPDAQGLPLFPGATKFSPPGRAGDAVDAYPSAKLIERDQSLRSFAPTRSTNFTSSPSLPNTPFTSGRNLNPVPPSFHQSLLSGLTQPVTGMQIGGTNPSTPAMGLREVGLGWNQVPTQVGRLPQFDICQNPFNRQQMWPADSMHAVPVCQTPESSSRVNSIAGSMISSTPSEPLPNPPTTTPATRTLIQQKEVHSEQLAIGNTMNDVGIFHAG